MILEVLFTSCLMFISWKCHPKLISSLVSSFYLNLFPLEEVYLTTRLSLPWLSHYLCVWHKRLSSLDSLEMSDKRFLKINLSPPSFPVNQLLCWLIALNHIVFRDFLSWITLLYFHFSFNLVSFRSKKFLEKKHRRHPPFLRSYIGWDVA